MSDRLCLNVWFCCRITVTGRQDSDYSAIPLCLLFPALNPWLMSHPFFLFLHLPLLLFSPLATSSSSFVFYPFSDVAIYFIWWKNDCLVIHAARVTESALSKAALSLWPSTLWISELWSPVTQPVGLPHWISHYAHKAGDNGAKGLSLCVIFHSRLCWPAEKAGHSLVPVLNEWKY